MLKEELEGHPGRQSVGFSKTLEDKLKAAFTRQRRCEAGGGGMFLWVIGGRGGGEGGAYILIGPANVPHPIADTEFWREVIGKESDYIALKKGGDLKVIYTIAGYEVQTRVGEYLT